MKQESLADKMVRWGRYPQVSMIGVYILMLYIYDWSNPQSPFILISHAGLGLFMYCLYVLYGFGKDDGARLNTLITSGPFRFTRHPMYTGVFLMNLSFWLPYPSSIEWHFFVLQAVFLTCLIAAGWFQERETLYRFGEEAEVYYQKTPRVFLFYPFMRSRIA